MTAIGTSVSPPRFGVATSSTACLATPGPQNVAMIEVTRLQGIAGAARATGPTIVIDTFRAFTTAAVMFDAGVDRIVLQSDLDAARTVAIGLGALLCGEDKGIKPDGFDLGNSPAEAAARRDLEGSTVVMRTSAGTRSVLAALEAGAGPVFAASLVVAAATAHKVAGAAAVHIVSAGLNGTKPSEEDDLTADYIEDVLGGGGDPDATAVLVATCDRAATIEAAPWAHADDVSLATDVDRFDFAMEAIRVAGHVELVRR